MYLGAGHVEIRGQYLGGVCVPHIHSCTSEPHPSPLLSNSFVIFVLFWGLGLALQPQLSRDSLCSPGWPLTLSSPSASASSVLGLQACVTRPSLGLLQKGFVLFLTEPNDTYFLSKLHLVLRASACSEPICILTWRSLYPSVSLSFRRRQIIIQACQKKSFNCLTFIVLQIYI